jgi:hypothetical protein
MDHQHRPRLQCPPSLPCLPALAAGLTLLTVACSAAGSEGREPPPHEIVEGQKMYTLLPPGGIPAINEPRFVSAEEADAFLKPEEPMLGVIGADGTAKAYSAWHLDGHEVVNDDLDGEPIAVTW